jgi:hypothetical protein
MQIKKRSKINKPIVVSALVILIGVAGFFGYSLLHASKKTATDNASTATEVSSDKQQSENLSKNPAVKTEAPNADKPAAPTANTSSASSKKQVLMTASTDMSGGTVYIRGGVNYPVTGGSCYAQLSGPSGQSIRKDTAVLRNPASTDCKTISIPVNELASGKWTFTLNYTSDNYEGVSSEISFSV